MSYGSYGHYGRRLDCTDSRIARSRVRDTASPARLHSRRCAMGVLTCNGPCHLHLSSVGSRPRLGQLVRVYAAPECQSDGTQLRTCVLSRRSRHGVMNQERGTCNLVSETTLRRRVVSCPMCCDRLDTAAYFAFRRGPFMTVRLPQPPQPRTCYKVASSLPPHPLHSPITH